MSPALSLLRAAALCALVSTAPAAVAQEPGCRNDMDCKGARVCEAGRCVDPAPRADPGPAPAPAPASTAVPPPASPPAAAGMPTADAPLSRTNFHFSVLGLLQFGLAPELEFGGATSFFVRARFFNTGLLSYYAIPSSNDKLNWGFGAGIGFRFYPLGNGSMRGFQVGGVLEWAYTSTTDDHSDYAQYLTHSLIPALDVGYRWVFGKFLIGVGITGGTSLPIAHEDVPVASASGPGCRYSDSCQGNRNLVPFGMLNVDLGWFL